MSGRSQFNELADTPATREALERLRHATGTVNGPMERHCLRTHEIATALAERRGWKLDRELLTVAAILHDIGLYPDASQGGVYTADGASLARDLLSAHGWDPERIQRCTDAIDRHHDLRSQLTRGGEVEALRRADLVDVSGGLVSFGLQRRWLRALNRDVPRAGLAAELRRELWRALRERPLTLPQIFLRP